jgi:hypothetical protein
LPKSGQGSQYFVVEGLGSLNYARSMPETIEHRLDEIEKRVAELGALVGAGPRKKDWLATVGTLSDDELSREADRLGQEYRHSLNDSADRAGA